MWFSLGAILAIGSVIFRSFDQPLSGSNLMWLSVACMALLMGEIFGRSSNPFVEEEPDRLVLAVTNTLAAGAVASSLISTLFVLQNEGFSISAIAWMGILTPIMCFAAKQGINFLGHRLYLRSVERKKMQAHAKVAVHQEWLDTQSSRFDEWERQYDAGKLPANYEELN
jgi:hypothetical protein